MRNNFIFTEFKRLLINDMIIYLIPLIGITSWQFSDSKIVFLTSTYSIGFIIFSKFSGYLIDKFSSVTVPIFTYLVYIMFNFIFIFTLLRNMNDFTIIFIIIVVMSLSSSVLEINTSVFIPDHFYEDLTSINSLVQLVRSVVNFISPIITFTLTSSITVAMFILLILQMLNLLIYTYKLRKLDINSYKKDVNQNNENLNLNSLKYILKNKKLILIIIVTMGINFSMTILTNTMVLYLVRYLELSNKLAGIIIGLLSFGAIVGSVLPTIIIKKFRFEKSIGVVNLILSIPFLFLISKSYLFFLGVFLGYLCRSFGSVLRTTVQYEIVPENIRGKVNATIYLFTWGTIPIAGYSASLLLETISLHTLYVIIALVFILANGLFLFSYNENNRLRRNV
ncbi:MFS transporter [Staphylococcus equorum]|uniref:MFS transporter n=1 Tax=Staphylococcus equorum TaxID=246432 RepID=UPI003FD70899